MPTELDSDQLFPARGSRADPMAEHKQRARWRVIGAVAYCVFVTVLALQVLRDKPRSLAPEFTVLMPLSSLPSSDRLSDAPTGLESVPGPARGSAQSLSEAPAGARPSSSPGVDAVATTPVAAPVDDAPAAPPTSDAQDPSDSYFVQVGAYGTRASAEAVRKRMEASGHRCIISAVGSGTALRYRVRVGPMSRQEADGVRARAKLQGYEAAVVK